MGAYNQKRTKFIVIKDKADRGKTTTAWMVFLELIRLGAKVTYFIDTYTRERIYPVNLPDKENRNDFIAKLEWREKSIVIISFGDIEKHVDDTLQEILPTEPDFIICAATIRDRARTTWHLFKEKYTNLEYERVCFWSEHAIHELDEERVKRSTVEAITKFML